MKKHLLKPVHPGEVLREDFMKPLKLSAYRVARDIGVEPITISMICRGLRSVSAEMALRLGRYTNTSPELWTGIQADYNLEVARRKMEKRVQKEITSCIGILPVPA